MAFNAERGLAAAESYQPSAILLDVGLPDHSGMSLLQQLKHNRDTRHIRVHMVSAFDNTEAAMQLGAVGYILKPATRELLAKIFGALAERAARRFKRVLLVEDDERQRSSMIALISDEDIEIVAVDSGEAASKQLIQASFDCMIVDLKLPDMQGNELLKRMTDAALAIVPPVIVYTGRNLTRDEEAELQRYSRSIIIKGAHSPERLLDEVTLFLHRPETGMSSERQAMPKLVRNRDNALEGRNQTRGQTRF